MSRRQCVLNSRHALYRVFVSPIECAEAVPKRSMPSLLRAPPSSITRLGMPLPVQLTPIQQTRSFVRPPKSSRRRRDDPAPAEDDDADDPDSEEAGRRIDPRYTTRITIERSGRDRMPKDHEITDPKIMVLDGGSVEGPLQTQFVLSKLEPTESLRMIDPYKPGNAKEGIQFSYAMCKVVNKQEEYENEKLRKERKRTGGKAKTKLVELGWAIGPHDLATKVRQMGGFLDKGMKVEVVLGKKKRAREATEEEARAVLDAINAEVEARGARESKPMDGELGATMRLYFEGVAKK